MYSTAPSTRRLTPNSAATTRARGMPWRAAQRTAGATCSRSVSPGSTRVVRAAGPAGIRPGYAKRPLLTRKVVYSHGS